MKQVVLVGGMDYDFKGVDFRVFCDNRMKRLKNANTKKEDLTFTILDVRRGEQETHEITFAGGKPTTKVTKVTPAPFSTLSKANYDKVVSGSETHFNFKNGQRGMMSAPHLYSVIQKIGKDNPSTLVEFSIFSHGWMGGPILVNSYDDGVFTISVPPAPPVSFALPSASRDPDDCDPRAPKDFSPPTMDAAALTDFQNAFHTDGFIWIWGCGFPRLVHEMLHKIERNSAYKDSGLGDDVLFKITNFEAAHADLLESYLSPALGGPLPDKKNIELKFKFLKHFFCLITTASYSQQLATAANRKVFAALMGTYSDYDTGVLPLMSIEKGFAKHFTFYKNYLGFGFDPEGRHYGAYLPGRTCAAPSP
jgi:hypothetical protein